MKLFKKLGPVLRGALKGAFPGVAGAVEAISNLRGKEVTVTTKDGVEVTGTAKPHSWWSIIPGLATAAFMIYMWHTGKLTEDQVSGLFQALISLMSN